MVVVLDVYVNYPRLMGVNEGGMEWEDGNGTEARADEAEMAGFYSLASSTAAAAVVVVAHCPPPLSVVLAAPRPAWPVRLESDRRARD